MTNEINICLASDNNYARLCGAAVCSLLKSAAPDDFLNIYILDNEISEENKKTILSLKNLHQSKIEFVEIENRKFFENLYLPKQKGYLSVSSYFRFMLRSLFPSLDRILYIDCDIIATSSVAEFYNTDLTGFYAAMIKDTACEDNQKRLNFAENETYYNSGVLLANLAKWRDDNIEQKLFDTLKEGLDDQDILNIVLKNGIKPVDETWNWQKKSKDFKGGEFPKLIHFITAFKPCFTGSMKSFDRAYFDAVKDTPFDSFYDRYLRRFCLNIQRQRNTVNITLWGMKTRIKF